MNIHKYTVILLIFVVLFQNSVVFSQQPDATGSSYPPEKYVEWFVRAVVLLDDMGQEIMATVIAQKLPQDNIYKKVAPSIENSKRFELISKRDLAYYHRDINKKIITEVKGKDLIYLVWLLSIVQNKLVEPTWAERLNVFIQKHWQENISKEIEQNHPKIHGWYKRFNQGQGVIFSKKLTGKGMEIARDVIQTKDNGFVLVGETDSMGQGRFDIIIAKHNADGKWLWTYVYGEKAKEIASRVIETSDGGFAIIGSTWSTQENRNDAWFIRTDAQGKKILAKMYGGKRGDDGVDVVEKPDGNFLLLMSSPSDSSITPQPVIMEIDQQGNVLWQKRIEIVHENISKRLRILSNGEILILGSIYLQENWEIYLLKLTSTGEKIWEQRYGGIKDDRAVDIHCNDAGFAILGSSNSFGQGCMNIWLIQTDKEGKKISDKAIGGGQYYSYATGLTISPDNQDWVITGYTTLFGTDQYSSWLVKISPNWNILWNKNIRDGQAKAVISCRDQGFAVVGERISKEKGHDIFLLKTDPTGKFEK